MGAKAAVLIGAVLTVLWLGSILAALDGRAAKWRNRFPALALHLLALIVILAIITNLMRPRKEA